MREVPKVAPAEGRKVPKVAPAKGRKVPSVAAAGGREVPRVAPGEGRVAVIRMRVGAFSRGALTRAAYHTADYNEIS